MSPLARPGRLFFLILATLIILDCASTLVRMRIGNPAQFLSSVVLPGGFIFIVVSLWQVEKRQRQIRSCILFVYGAGSIFQYGRLIYSMALEIPPGKLGDFLEVTATLMGLPILRAGFYVFASLALLYSPSLNSFFEHQSHTAQNPWSALGNWLLGFVRMDRATREARQFWRDYENRPRYPVLTRAILKSLNDRDLFGAIQDYVSLKVERDSTKRFAIVSSLPRRFQAVYSTWWVAAEISNGGFHQYFYNQGTDWAFMALEGYKLFGAHETAALMARAIEIHLFEETERLIFPDVTPAQMIDGFVKSREASKLPELDRLFYETHDGKPVEYIRAHLDEFVAD